MLVTGGDDSGLHLWEVATGKRIRSFLGAVDQLLAVAVTANTTEDKPTTAQVRVATFGQAHVRVLDLLGKTTVWTSPSAVRLDRGPRVSFSPRGTHIAFGTRGKPVHIYDLQTGKAASFAPAVTMTGALALGLDGKTLACRVKDVEVALWEHDSKQLVRNLPGKRYNDILSLAFSPDGKVLAMGSKGNYVQLVDPATGKKTAKSPEGAGWIYGLAFNRNQSRLLVGGPYSALTLRSLPDLKKVHRMLGHRGSVHSVAFSADESRLLSVGGGGTLRIWDAKSGKNLATLYALAEGRWVLQTPDGRWDASSGADAHCAWSVVTAKGLGVQPLASKKETRVEGLARVVVDG